MKAVPFRVIPERGQVGENSSEPSSKESCDVLHDDVAGSKLANEARVFAPKTRACPADPGSFASEADVLAGEAAAEDINVWHRHTHGPIPFAWADSLGSLRLFLANARSAESSAVGVRHKGAHVGITRNCGPMPGKDSTAELLLLALPHNAHTGSFEAEVEAADAAEQ